MPIPTGDPEAIALRSGSLIYNGPRMFYAPEPIPLCGNLPDESQTRTFEARIPVPDSRIRVKLSVLFFPLTTTNPINGNGTIWVAAHEEDTKGRSGSTGKTVPVTNVEGTQAAPTSFPATAGLLGYSREFVTAADWLVATISINSGQNFPGSWVLQTRIQPESVTLGWKEWEQIRALFLPLVI